MDVPCPFHFRQHNHIEIIANRFDNLRHIVEDPRAIQGIDADPQSGVAEIRAACDFNETGPRRLFGIDRNAIFQISTQDVDLLGGRGNLGTNLLDVRRKEMNHTLGPHGQFSERLWRPNCERFVEMDRWFHELNWSGFKVP